MNPRPSPGNIPPSRHPSTDSDFGLVGWLENTRVVLPLKAVDCRFSVCGDVASVRVDQVFHQENNDPINCTYSFPLPHGAAVYRCEMHVNDRVITAKVEDQATARQIAREKAAEGRRTALVEVERDNLFTLSLSNVQPEDLVVVRLAFFQALDHLGDERSLRVPFNPGIRYIPGKGLIRENTGAGTIDDTDEVPDASRISPPRIDDLHPDAAELHVEGTIQSAGETAPEISSPSHPIKVTEKDSTSTITLARSRDLPNRDLVLRWTETVPADKEQLAAWISAGSSSDENDYALVELRAPREITGGKDDKFEQDVYFLIDQSGSMAGAKWQKAVRAFQSFLGVLGARDRVFATLFESNFQDIAEKPLKAKRLLKDAGVRSLEALGTLGGTNIHPALEHILKAIDEHSKKRPATLVIITDGQVGNEPAILQRLARHPELRVHTFGIDTAVNDAFLQQIAAQQRGTCCLRTPADDIEGAVTELGAMIGRPALLDLQAEGAWEAPSGAIPDLFAGQVVSVLLKRKSGSEEEPLRISGRLADGSEKTHTLAPTRIAEPAIELLWAQRRIAHHLAEQNQDAALELAREKNILCRGAAFIAWDGAEKVALADPAENLVQPSLMMADACLISKMEDFETMEPSLLLESSAPRFRKSISRKELRAREVPAPDVKAHNMLQQAAGPELFALLSQDEATMKEILKWLNRDETRFPDRFQLLVRFLGHLQRALEARQHLLACIARTSDILRYAAEDPLEPDEVPLIPGDELWLTAPFHSFEEIKSAIAKTTTASGELTKISQALEPARAALEKALHPDHPDLCQKILEKLEHTVPVTT